MERVSVYLKNNLKDLYPDGEIKSFIQIVWCDLLKKNPLDIYMQRDTNLSDSEQKLVEEVVGRLARFEPIQYICGSTTFCGLTFGVAPGVLIPRPETQELIELIVHENTCAAPAILDIGTGSGCIAISLAKSSPTAKVEAWDVSQEALKIANQNNEALNAGVRFVACDVLDDKCLPRDTQFDIIVSNPPYIANSEKQDMERNVLDWEPDLALFVSDSDPLLFYRTIAQRGLILLNPHGKLYFEINRRFGQETIDMLSEMGYKECRVIKDFYGNDRIVTAQR